MFWYNILNPRDWPGVTVKTGNNRIDGNYYNLLSSNQVSLAASGSMFLAANSGIKLISPSFVDASGIRATRILAENYGRINSTGGLIPLYSGDNNGLIVKLDDDNVYSTDIITYDQNSDELRFPSANDGGVLYTVPFFTSQGSGVQSTKKISSFSQLSLKPRSTDTEGVETDPATITFSAKTFANDGLSIGPNNFLESYKGFILTHDGSGNVAQWKPATYLRENYDTSLAIEGLERVGINWIRFPRRPAQILNGKLYIYQTERSWSPYPTFTSIDQIKKELGTGSDTLCVTKAVGEATVGYTKFAFVDKAGAEQSINSSFNFDDRIATGTVIDPDGETPSQADALCWIIDIAPEDPGGISDGPGSNVLVFSVTKGAYFPMQIEQPATNILKLRSSSANNLSGIITTNDDGTELEEPMSVNLTFKPSTFNNISIRPTVHTAFNMLGEDIDFLIYGKEYTPFNTYDNTKFGLNDNYIPSGLVPIFKIDALIPNSVVGSPTGVLFSQFIDRQKTQPIGWNFDYSGKVCIKTNEAYELASIPSGSEGSLKSYADVTISGHTYTTSLLAEDIYLKPVPLANNTGKYIRNALLTVDGAGRIISRTPRINPTTPGTPSGLHIDVFGNQAETISWIPPSSDGNSKILNYLLQISMNDGATWSNLPIENNLDIITGFAGQTSATIEPMDNFPGALFRVAAQNAVGIGEYSDSTETPYTNNINAPKIPINLTYERNINSDILSDITLYWNWNQGFSWGANAGASGFLIEEASFDGANFSSFSGIALVEYDSSITEYSHNETGLSGKDNYLYRISSVNTNSLISAHNYIYSTGLVMLDIDLEEEENKRTEELSNFDFGVIMFTGSCVV